MIQPEPIVYTQFQLAESHWLDQIVTRSQLKSPPQYIYLSSSANHDNRDIAIMITNKLYDLESIAFTTICRELEICQYNIISSYQVHL